MTCERPDPRRACSGEPMAAGPSRPPLSDVTTIAQGRDPPTESESESENHDESHRPGRLWPCRRPGTAGHRPAGGPRRRSAPPRAGGRCRAGRLASHDGAAVHGPHGLRTAQAQAPGPGLGRRGTGRGGRREGDPAQARGRGLRQLRGLLRRVRPRQARQAGAQAAQHQLRTGRRGPRLRRDRPPGRTRQGTGAGRPEGARRRRLGRRRHVRRPAGRRLRGRGHRRLRPRGGSPRPFPRRRRRHRLHPRGDHRPPRPLRRHPRRRGQPAPVPPAPRAHAARHAGHRGRRGRRPLARHRAARCGRSSCRRSWVRGSGPSWRQHGTRICWSSADFSRPARSHRSSTGPTTLPRPPRRSGISRRATAGARSS